MEGQVLNPVQNPVQYWDAENQKKEGKHSKGKTGYKKNQDVK